MSGSELFAKQSTSCNTPPEPARNCDRQENAVVQADAGVESAGPNDPRAPRMGAIALLSHNIIIGSIFGTAGVLLIPLQDRFHVSRGPAAIGVPMVIVGS